MEYKHKYTRLAYAYITYAVAIICGFVLFSSCSNDDAAQRNGIVRIGIAWRGDLRQGYADKVKANPFAGQNIGSILAGLDGLVFTGGSDISPTLYKTPEPWHGIVAEGNSDGRRDVSDYILMRWCLEREPMLPVLCICRGM